MENEKRRESPQTDPYFPLALRYTWQNEIGDKPNGGYVFHPKDRGGPTKWGVSYRALCEWRGITVPFSEMESLRQDEAERILLYRYWHAMKCAGIKRAQIAMALFDISVLFGVKGASRYTQRALNATGYALAVDGEIGPKTLEALGAVNAKRFLGSLQSVLLDVLHDIVAGNPEQAVFIKGWVSRVKRLQTLV